MACAGALDDREDWYSVLNAESCQDKFRLLIMELTSAVDSFLPRKIVKRHPTDHPWISKNLKSWIRKRQSAWKGLCKLQILEEQGPVRGPKNQKLILS